MSQIYASYRGRGDDGSPVKMTSYDSCSIVAAGLVTLARAMFWSCISVPRSDVDIFWPLTLTLWCDVVKRALRGSRCSVITLVLYCFEHKCTCEVEKWKRCGQTGTFAHSVYDEEWKEKVNSSGNDQLLTVQRDTEEQLSATDPTLSHGR